MSYFSSENINITIILMQGNHTLKNCGIHIKHLETCKITGVGSASNVRVYTLQQNISFADTATIYIENLTLIGRELLYTTPVLMFDYNQMKQSNDSYRLRFITINGTEMKGISILPVYTNRYFIIIVLANSIITNGSRLHLYSPFQTNGVKKDCVLQLRMTKCFLSNSYFFMHCESATVLIEDSTIIDMLPMGVQSGIHLFYSNISITGNASLSNVTNGDHSAFISSTDSNVTITGYIAFSYNKITPIILYFSIITLSGNITFLNNTGMNGGAIHTSTLTIAGNTRVYFYNNTATDTGGAINFMLLKLLLNKHCQISSIYKLGVFTNC